MKNLIAIYFLALIIGNVAGIIETYEATSGPPPGSSLGWSIWAAKAFWVSLALLSIYYLYPEEPERFSLETGFFASAACLFAGGALLWFVAPEVYTISGEKVIGQPGAEYGLLWWIARRDPGSTSILMVGLCAAIWRARSADEQTRTITAILLPALSAAAFVLLGMYLGQGVFQLAGTREALANTLAYFSTRPADVANLLPGLFIFQNVLAIGLVAYLVWRHRSVLALAMVISGFMFTTVRNLRFVGMYPAFQVWAPLAVLYVVGRHRAFGGDHRDRRAWDRTAGIIAALIFTLVLAAALAKRPQEATVPIGIVLASILGTVAGVVVHPDGWFLRDVFRFVSQGPGTPGPQPRGHLGDRFNIVEPLGSGGSGEVHRARDTVLDREVAVKAMNGAGGGQEAWERLREEARLLSKIDHPSILAVHDLVRIDGAPHLVMEYAPGGSLADTLEDGPFPGEELGRIGAELTDALQEIHDRDLLHRDIKPSNVLIGRDRTAKLGDFGIARSAADQTALEWHGPGSPKGTVAYMSPEQAKGMPVDARSDLFSLGATLYEAYTGEPYVQVHPGESVVEVQMRVAGLGPFNRDIDGPEPLREWFAAALAPRPEDRFESAETMGKALSSALDPTPG